MEPSVRTVDRWNRWARQRAWLAAVLAVIVMATMAQLLGLNSLVHRLTTHASPMPFYLPTFFGLLLALFSLSRVWHSRLVPPLFAAFGFVVLSVLLACYGAYLVATLSMPHGVQRLVNIWRRGDPLVEVVQILFIVPIWLLTPLYAGLLALSDVAISRILRRVFVSTSGTQTPLL
jgi:hypothetical protein